MDNAEMSRQNDPSDKLSRRSEARKSSGNKSEIVNSKEVNRITQLHDKDSINKSAPVNKSNSFEESSGSSPHLDDAIISDCDRKTTPAIDQVANQEEEGNTRKSRKDSYGDSNSQEDCPAEARHVISKGSSTRAEVLNGTLDNTKAKRGDTKSKSKAGNIAAKTNVHDDRRHQKSDDHKINKRVYDTAKSCDSGAENKRTRVSRTATSKRSVPIEHHSADQHESNIKTTKASNSKGKDHDKAGSRVESKVDEKYSKDIKERAESIDKQTAPRSSSPKYNKGGTRSKNGSCKSRLNNRSGISVPEEVTSLDAETRGHYGEETSEVRKTSDSSNIKITVSDSEKSRSSSSSRSSGSGGNSGSGSNRSRSGNSRSSRSGSDSSRSNNSRSSSSGSDSSKGNSFGSNSTRSVRSSRNGSPSSREGSANSLSRHAGTGAIPRKRDDLAEVHSESSTNKRSAADNTTSVARNNSESNSSRTLVRDDKHRSSRSRTSKVVQKDKRECSRNSETRKRRSCPETETDSSDLEGKDNNTQKNKKNHLVTKSEKIAKEFRPSYHLNHSKPIGPNVHLEYEWQYRDDRGGWVTYGQSGGNASVSKMVASEDIEKYYTEDPDRTPLLIEFNNNKYILDFQQMKQTSQRTAYQRDIRRILKLPENKNLSRNMGGHSGSSAATGRNNTSGGRYDVDHPLNAGDGRADPGMRYDNNKPAETNAGRGYAGNSAQGRDDPSVTIEWQFKDKHGKWIAYGNANTYFDKSNATTSRSEDIEKAYSNKNMPYFVIESSRNSYMLDFEQMVQTNDQTEVKRPIRRMVKESSKKEGVVKTVGKLFGNLTGQKQNKKKIITAYEWQFLDERGVWITYGQANSAGNVVGTTSTTSDDIEKFFSSGPNKQRMAITSTHNTYSLNFRNMTQTNTRTSIQRPIRRVLKNDRNASERNYNRNTPAVSLYTNRGYNSANVAPERPMNTAASTANHGYNSAYVAPGRLTNKSASTHLWQFEDERGRWITYGQSCSTVAGSGTTTAATDDIEEYYLKNNGEMPMFVSNNYNNYILDFQTMCQTNQSTSVQRRIRRITKPIEITRNHWR